MGDDERQRAGRAIADRAAEIGLTIPELAEKAGVHPTTVRGLIRGDRWCRETTRAKIIEALGWERSELARRTWGGQVALSDATLADLATELCQRLTSEHETLE